jgi:hypothetical protein
MNVFKDYPYYTSRTFEELVTQVDQICRTRKDDILVIGNLQNIFVGGRSVGRVPTSAADVLPTDKIGDINFDYATGYAYRLMDDGVDGIWARWQLDMGF